MYQHLKKYIKKIVQNVKTFKKWFLLIQNMLCFIFMDFVLKKSFRN